MQSDNEALRAAFDSIATVIQGAYLNGQLPPISDAELAEKIITDYSKMRAERYEYSRIADLEVAANDSLRSWIKAANQFAWAHERNCPRHDADAACTCGLDSFLSRRRPFIESYKEELASAQASSYEQGKRADASEAKLQYALKIGTSAETRIVERRFSLQDRVTAVITAVHAHDYVAIQTDTTFIDRVNARTLLWDGIANAIDGRSTGREHATVRHSYRNERDGPHPPTVADADRRCQQCGAVNPPYFQHCCEHMPPRVLVDADPTAPDALTGCASVQSPDIVEAEEPPYRLILEVSRDKLLEAQRHTGLNYSDLIARIDMVLADASPQPESAE